MKKKRTGYWRAIPASLMIRVLCLGWLLHFSAAVWGQDANKRISVHFKNTPLREACNDIEEQTGFSFSYSENTLLAYGKNITLSLPDAALTYVLSRIFDKSPVAYNIRGKLIFLSLNPNYKPDEASPKAPGRVTGKVIDEGTGEALPDVSIQVGGKGAVSGIDGVFSITLSPGKYEATISSMGYGKKSVSDIIVKEGKVLELNTTLKRTKSTLAGIVVRSTARKENIAALYTRQKNSASTTDGISREQIQRTPDNNTAQVLSRVSGLNIQDNKYVTVRGLSDRYNNVMLNGSQLPSTEPNKRNFAFDIIPSSVIDNVIVHKTATADLSGEFSGGTVEVETRAIPVSDFFRIKLGTGINTKATGKDFYQPQRGKYDFLAFDDGKKQMGKGFNNDEYGALTFGGDPEKDARRNELMQLFPNRFKFYNYKGLPVQDYDISGGKAVDLKNAGRLGLIAGLSYRNQQTATDYIDQLLEADFFDYRGREYEFITNWSVMLNAGYSFGKNKIAVKNIYTRRLSESTYLYNGPDLENKGRQYRGYANTPLINSIMQTRLEGEHKTGDKGPLLKWHLSKAHTGRTEPDNKVLLGLSGDSLTYQYSWATDALGWASSYFSDFSEDRYTWEVAGEMPFRLFKRRQLIKGGYQGSYREASFIAEMYAMRGNGKLTGLPYYDVYAPENFKVGSIVYVPYLSNSNQSNGKTNGYDGFQRINSGYLMLDGQLLNHLRVVAGLRVEKYTTANRSSQLMYAGDTPVRKDSVVSIDKTDWLPSVSLIYALTPQTNLRASYFGSVARPDLRELSFFQYYDAARKTYTSGRDLKPTSIQNVDLRLEYYPQAGEIISISGFYKKFKNPIELQMRDLTSSPKVAEMFYRNLEKATNVGIELNFRKSFGFLNSNSDFLGNLFLSGNFTWMKSKLTLEGGKDIIFDVNTAKILIPAQQSRPLWGQAPYLVNGGLLYAGEKIGLNLSYTRVGERIIYGAEAARYNEWEKARDVFDFQVSYRFARNNRAEIKLNASDMLNQPVIRYFNGSTVLPPDSDGISRVQINSTKYNSREDVLRRKYQYGRNFSFSFSYQF
ncbi:outer membrane receptor protein involved in Fe transport [Chitinophaga terrae (ex Kim and Jung 2007)]|uniref:TonB-dependent receptor n=1 Tax=Chitinophaga terrae (ex Kim and Jung 2007) TaxID=408074 RepID=UPI002783790F|nr:TonB-dependent receptor [Chitinophaga terrae (ex Kim and Jung 2007)]MDQ0110236.1 outer membrane receptor protein involved in Fe transport [Chitinophaga terrae (ex Kim and Jung 2007)]